MPPSLDFYAYVLPGEFLGFLNITKKSQGLIISEYSGIFIFTNIEGRRYSASPLILYFNIISIIYFRAKKNDHSFSPPIASLEFVTSVDGIIL